MPSVPIPKFGSLCGTLVCELRNRRTLRLIDLVWLWFRSPHFGLAARMMRTSEPPHCRGIAPASAVLTGARVADDARNCAPQAQRNRPGKGPPMEGAKSEADRQLPIADEIFLDHVGHFVRDPEAATRALVRAGFAPTPVSIQVNPAPDGAPRLTGTGNTTAMFARGYIEALFRTADTPAQPRAHGGDGALSRRASRGLRGDRCGDGASASDRFGFSHAAIGADAAPGRHRRGTRDGGVYARAGRAGRNAGGPHPNSHPPDRAHGVAAALAFTSERRDRAHQCSIVAADVAETAQRFARFTGRARSPSPFGQTIELDRGRVDLVTRTASPGACRKFRSLRSLL